MTDASIRRGEPWRGRNWSADEKGSIHDDATAGKLGFRGGTVAGSIHMDQFVPVLVGIFGERWFRDGTLSLKFLQATVDGEAVRVLAEEPAGGREQVAVWMAREEDDAQICTGTASLGDASESELHTCDLRGCDPSELRILREVRPGLSLGEHALRLSGAKQAERLGKGLISAPLDWYSGSSPWGGAIATPSTAVELLWFHPAESLRSHIANAVGLFGAIEISHLDGPLLLEAEYVVRAGVIAVAQSPKTEICWFDSIASASDGREVASMRMMLRFMKASSALYPQS